MWHSVYFHVSKGKAHSKFYYNFFAMKYFVLKNLALQNRMERKIAEHLTWLELLKIGGVAKNYFSENLAFVLATKFEWTTAKISAIPWYPHAFQSGKRVYTTYPISLRITLDDHMFKCRLRTPPPPLPVTVYYYRYYMTNSYTSENCMKMRSKI